MRRIVMLAGLASFLVVTRAASAQDGGACPGTIGYQPDEFFPASGAGGVATDTAVRIRYTPGSAATIVDPPDTLVTVARATTPPTLVDGTAQWLGDTLVFRPRVSLAPSATYTGTATGPDGTATFTFTTGTGPDRGPPTLPFDGIELVASTPTGATCEAPDGGYRIDVTVDQAVDDGAPGDIEYLLFVTRASGLHAPMLVARQRNFATTMTIPMSFVAPTSEAVTRLCVAVLAVDDTGNVAESVQKCIDPIMGNYFEGLCSVTAVRPARIADGVAGLALFAVLPARRRRRSNPVGGPDGDHRESRLARADRCAQSPCSSRCFDRRA